MVSTSFEPKRCKKNGNQSMVSQFFFFQMEDTSKSSHILHLFDGEANSFGPLDISERDQLIDTTQVFNT